jgi:NAD(P)-dependent dehydrogenase (short-subunit alcohol dehydrogenase family)
MSGIIILLKGKTALITGGTAGIGKGIARALGEAGARVVINGIDETRGRAAEQELRQLGIETHFYAADISDDAALARMVQQTVAWFGRLDILVNNAAYLHPEMYQPLAQLPQAEWDKALAVNYRAAVVACRAALPELQKTRGCILNISSVGAVEPFANATAYCPTKAALEHFTRGLARELAPQGIRVNAIAPGWIDTPGVAFHTSDVKRTQEVVAQKIPLGRLGQPVDVANCAAFVVSDLASYMTGTVVTVDGGWLLV